MIEIKDLNKSFGELDVLKDISLTINDGEIYGLVGRSGAGKSTLLRCINGLEKYDSGSLKVDGIEVKDRTEEELRVLRKEMGMIFQSFSLVGRRNIYKNVALPMKCWKYPKDEQDKKVRELLDLVGISEKMYDRPDTLSGGQKQRVAIARALTLNPKILLCDEATSALDPKTTQSVLDLLQDINKKLGITVIVITHQMSVVEEICNKVAILDGGCMAEEGLVTDVFSNPQSQAAKQLVYPDGLNEILPDIGDNKVLRVIFDGALAAGSPLITQMAIDEGIAANILFASTRCMDDKVYGTMLLGLSNEADIVVRAKKYLQSCKNVIVKEENE